jgi:hypothetical protein
MGDNHVEKGDEVKVFCIHIYCGLPPISAGHAQNVIRIIKQGDFIWIFYVLYSTLFHLPTLRFHCGGGCWD